MPSDADPVETSEWQEAFDSVIQFDGADRAGFLLEELIREARRNGVPVPYSANTPYLNTIPPNQEPAHPGDGAIEHADPVDHPVERGGHRAAGQQGILRAGWAHRLLPVRRDAV